VSARARRKMFPSRSAAATMIFVPPMSNPTNTVIDKPLDFSSF